MPPSSSDTIRLPLCDICSSLVAGASSRRAASIPVAYRKANSGGVGSAKRSSSKRRSRFDAAALTPRSSPLLKMRQQCQPVARGLDLWARNERVCQRATRRMANRISSQPGTAQATRPSLQSRLLWYLDLRWYAKQSAARLGGRRFPADEVASEVVGAYSGRARYRGNRFDRGFERRQPTRKLRQSPKPSRRWPGVFESGPSSVSVQCRTWQ